MVKSQTQKKMRRTKNFLTISNASYNCSTFVNTKKDIYDDVVRSILVGTSMKELNTVMNSFVGGPVIIWRGGWIENTKKDEGGVGK